MVRALVPGAVIFGRTRYVLALVDTCVWPSNSAYLHACLTAFNSLLASSPKYAGHLQIPVLQAQTHQAAVVKHRRTLEDSLVANGLDIMRPVSLIFDKGSLPAGDKRDPWHPCLLVTATAHENNAWFDSAVAQNRCIGPCPLIRVADMLGFDSEARSSASQRTEQLLVEVGSSHIFVAPWKNHTIFSTVRAFLCSDARKGVPAHVGVIAEYVRGMPIAEHDIVVLVDLLPNRLRSWKLVALCSYMFFFHMVWGSILRERLFTPAMKTVARRQAEFARAAIKRMLDGTTPHPEIRYCGHFRADQKDVTSQLEEAVYTHWDSSNSAPARSRPVDPKPDPTFSLLTWRNNRASFPESVLRKFAEGSDAHAQMLELKKRLAEEFPDSVEATPTQATGTGRTPRRATGRPDFSIDGGKSPIDYAREVEKEHIPASSFTVERRGISSLQSCLCGGV